MQSFNHDLVINITVRRRLSSTNTSKIVHSATIDARGPTTKFECEGLHFTLGARSELPTEFHPKCKSVK